MPSSYRYGKAFWDTYNFLQESQWWSREKLEVYQMQQLEKLLRHAYENVPYYRRVFDERGLQPKDIQSTDDLRKLPYLTKEIIRKNFDRLLAKNFPKRDLKLLRTSGSTAIPLSFYIEKRITASLENAFIETLWNRVGYHSKYKRVNITWEQLNKKNSWWEYNPASKILMLSPSQMNDENLYNYVKKIEEFEPIAIQAIPSTIMLLANFMLRNNVPPFSSVKAILLGSEMLYPWQRKKITKAFNSRIFSLYGQNEKVILAGECEQSTEYHIFSEYGITELISQSGDRIKQTGERTKLVGTGFNNYVMPFIRYETNDIAILSNKKCSCGRNYLLIEKIEGRNQEYIVLKNGTLVPLLSLPFSSFLLDVKQFQFYQETAGEVILKIVKMPSYNDNNTEYILKGLSEGLNNIKIDLKFVNEIPRTERGKYMYMIQNIPIKLD
jgi:phenylacetate-CoA ligase